MNISAGDTGYGYDKVFGDCLDGNIEWVEVKDPYIRAKHQVIGFLSGFKAYKSSRGSFLVNLFMNSKDCQKINQAKLLPPF